MPRQIFYIIFLLLSSNILISQDSELVMAVIDQARELENDRKYAEAIDYLVARAQEFKETENWDGFVESLVRAAEIEGDEIWKLASLPELTGGDESHGYGQGGDLDFEHARILLERVRNETPAVFIQDGSLLDARIKITEGYCNDWLGDSELGLNQLMSALEIRKDNYPEFSFEIGEILEWIGVIYRFGFLDTETAEPYLYKALEIHREYDTVGLNQAHVLYTLVGAVRTNQQLQEAESLAREAADLYRRHGLNDQIANVYQSLSAVFAKKDDFDKALEYNSLAIGELSSKGLWKRFITPYTSRADYLIATEQIDSALIYVLEALRIAEELKSKDLYLITNAMMGLAEAYQSLKQFELSNKYLDQALDLALSRYGPRSTNVTEILQDRADLSLEIGSFESAARDQHRILMGHITDFPLREILQTPEIITEGTNLFVRAQAFYGKGDVLKLWGEQDNDTRLLELALETYRRGNTQLFIARRQIRDEISRTILSNQLLPSIERSVSLAQQLWRLTEDKNYLDHAFQFIETSKYMLVFDAIQRAAKEGVLEGADTLSHHLADVNFEIELTNRIISTAETTELDADSIENLNEQGSLLMDRRRRIIEEIRENHPAYFQMNYDSVLLSSSEIQNELRNDEQLLEFFWGEEDIYLMSVTADSIVFHKIPRLSEIDSALVALIQMLKDRDSHFEDYADVDYYAQLAVPIYEFLLKPYASREKLIIIPDGPLAYIPFGALVSTLPNGRQNFMELNYLIREKEFSYAYSANILFGQTYADQIEIEAALAMSFSDNDEDPESDRTGFLTPLRGSYDEIQNIRRLLPHVTRRSEGKAGKDVFLKLAPGHDLIHLAIHGLGDQDQAGNSRLIFFGDEEHAGELFEYEIFGMELQADLAVLSACESGVGKYENTEGVFSIARAFVYAGCPSIVMSLWRVPDKTTADIMDHFYQNLKDGRSLSTSVQLAKLEYLRTANEINAFPGNWAAFVANGHNASYSFKPNYQPYYLGAFGLLGIMILVWWRRRRKLN